MKSIFTSATSAATNAISQASEKTKKLSDKAKQGLLSSDPNVAVASIRNLKIGAQSLDSKLRSIEKEPVRLAGVVWKRRGGLGKLVSASAWESRHIELKGHTLLYYASKDYDDEATGGEAFIVDHHAKSNTVGKIGDNIAGPVPRGYLDLSEDKATVQATFGHSGAPSPFCISIKVGLTSETKWKLCFDHHKTQMEWLAAMSDAIIQSSVDDYNVQLLQAANPNNNQGENVFLRPPPVYEPKSDGDTSEDERQSTVHRLWMTEEYSIKSSAESKLENINSNEEAHGLPPKVDTPLDQALHVMETLLAEKEKVRVSMEKKNKSLQEELLSSEKKLQEVLQVVEEEYRQKSEMQKKDIERTHVAMLNEVKEDYEARMRQAIEEKLTLISKITSEKDSIRVSMEHKVKAVEEKLAATVQNNQQTLISLEDEHQKTLELLKSEMELWQSQAMAKTKDCVESPLLETIKEKDSQITQMSLEKESLGIEMKEKTMSLQQEISALEQKVVSHQQEILALEKKQKQALSILEEEHQRKLELQQNEMEARHRDVLVELKDSTESPLRQEIQEKDAQITQLSKEMDGVRHLMEEKLNSLKEKLVNAEDEYQKLLRALQDKHQHQLELHKKEIEAQTSRAMIGLKGNTTRALQVCQDQLSLPPDANIDLNEDDDEFLETEEFEECISY